MTKLYNIQAKQYRSQNWSLWKVAFSKRRRLMVIKQKILFGKIETSLMLI